MSSQLWGALEPLQRCGLESLKGRMLRSLFEQEVGVCGLLPLNAVVGKLNFRDGEYVRCT
jgi:hypothetical protein